MRAESARVDGPRREDAVDHVVDQGGVRERGEHAGDRQLVDEQAGLGIWLCGGGQLASALLPEIDELVVKQYPLLLGAGIPLFAEATEPRTFGLGTVRPFESGAVVLTYTRAL